MEVQPNLLYHFISSGYFQGSKIQHGIFLGLILVRFLLVFCWKSYDFLGIDFCPQSHIPITLNPE